MTEDEKYEATLKSVMALLGPNMKNVQLFLGEKPGSPLAVLLELEKGLIDLRGGNTKIVPASSYDDWSDAEDEHDAIMDDVEASQF